MPLRVLCLHGMGVNADIMRKQTASFRSLLPSFYEFTFVDGGSTCDAAPGVAEFYPGPYRCWYDTPTTKKVAKAHRRVFAIIRQEGPFDAVMGFSQGASLAASMILHHQIERPSEPPLFRVAIFICSPLPFSSGLHHGIDARTYFGLKATKPLSTCRPTKVPEYLIPKDPYFMRGDNEAAHKDSSKQSKKSPAAASAHRSPHLLNDGHVSVSRKTNQQNDEQISGPHWQMFHPTVDTVRISIPTAHIGGQKDFWRPHSNDLMKLCDGRLASVFEHDGGHEVPKFASEEICDVIETVVAKADLCS
ncbi:MAG: hypothetical protein M1837_007515 [Sclerophora amabilis]|nr:MAG: hypothetical protein M1837_007515 [Sclerophora amabilis]